MAKIMVMVGTRPEAIKLAPVIKELKSRPQLEVLVCDTGQHKEMLDTAFADFEIAPDLKLEIMQQNQSLASLSAHLFEKVDKILEKEKPDWLIVQGDTTTVMISALCAFYRHIKIAHIEAGLRSYNKFSPFPEEINRQFVSKIADLHFTPTQNSCDNLLKEGIRGDIIEITGNTVIDALLWMRSKIEKNPPILDEKIAEAIRSGKKIILMTGHRRENIGNKMEAICSAILSVANERDDVLFVYPMHLNPVIRRTALGILNNHPRILLIDPLPYKEFISLLNNSYMVMTDSGGIQEEAPSFGKPVLIIREETERPEGIKANIAKLAGTNTETIIKNILLLLNDSKEWQKMSQSDNPYGNGRAAKYIVDRLMKETTN